MSGIIGHTMYGILGAKAAEARKLPIAAALTNRRYLKKYLQRLLPEYELTQAGNERQCRPELSRQSGGLSDSQMVAAADRAGLRDTLWQIGEEIGRLFEQVVTRVPALAEIPPLSAPTWETLQQRWQKPKETP